MRMVMLVQQGCRPCEETKEAMQGYISEGEIEVVDIDTEEGRRIMQEAGTDKVPSLILLTKKGEVVINLSTTE